ncbi:MAG: AbrB/MazE/SpoVT family DNA-binding domain-containing protein [Bacteroidota bacterium]
MTFKTINISKKFGKQSLSIPENLKIDDDKVYLKKVGNILYVIPYHNPWQNLVDSLEQFSDDFMQDRNQPTVQKRETLG